MLGWELSGKGIKDGSVVICKSTFQLPGGKARSEAAAVSDYMMDGQGRALGLPRDSTECHMGNGKAQSGVEEETVEG